MNDLNFSMQSLREQLINSKNVNKQLQQEIYVNNLIKLCELGLISKEDLKQELRKTEYSIKMDNKCMIQGKVK